VFVGNLEKRATRTDVRDLFEPYGTVRHVRWVGDKNGGIVPGAVNIRYLSHWADQTKRPPPLAIPYPI
jgi:RNA recognition motif-containing protein